MNRRELQKVSIILIVFLLSVFRYYWHTDVMTDYATRITNPISEYIYNSIGTNKVRVDGIGIAESDGSDTNKVIKREINALKNEIIVKDPNNIARVDGPAIHNGALIGEVVSEGEGWARIRLITDPRFRVAAKTDHSSGVVKSLQGNLVYDLVNRPDENEKIIMTSGLNGQFPPNLVIGITGDRIDLQQTTFATYQVDLPFNPLEINHVSFEQ